MTILLSLIFIATLLSLTGAAFALILKNLSDINKLNKPRKIRLSHPELEGVKQGDELLVVKYKQELDTEGTIDIQFTPDDQFTDKILEKSLQKRLDELSDDDDDGDVLVPQ